MKVAAMKYLILLDFGQSYKSEKKHIKIIKMRKEVPQKVDYLKYFGSILCKDGKMAHEILEISMEISVQGKQGKLRTTMIVFCCLSDIQLRDIQSK